MMLDTVNLTINHLEMRTLFAASKVQEHCLQHLKFKSFVALMHVLTIAGFLPFLSVPVTRKLPSMLLSCLNEIIIAGGCGKMMPGLGSFWSYL